MKPAEGKMKPTVERDTPTSAVVNGNQSPGMLQQSRPPIWPPIKFSPMAHGDDYSVQHIHEFWPVGLLR